MKFTGYNRHVVNALPFSNVTQYKVGEIVVCDVHPYMTQPISYKRLFAKR